MIGRGKKFAAANLGGQIEYNYDNNKDNDTQRTALLSLYYGNKDNGSYGRCR